MSTDNKLLDEFKELVEAASLEILKEVQMKEVAKDVVTNSYKAEIANALEVISGEIERVKNELKGLNYISEEEIKALVQGAYENQMEQLKAKEEQLKNIVDQRTQELYIVNEKMRSDIQTMSEQVGAQLNQQSTVVKESMNEVGAIHRNIVEGFEGSETRIKAYMKKLFGMSYGLMGIIIALLIFILLRGIYGA